MFTEFSEGDFLASMPCVTFAKIVQVSINYDIYELLIHRLLVIHRVWVIFIHRYCVSFIDIATLNSVNEGYGSFGVW